MVDIDSKREIKVNNKLGVIRLEPQGPSGVGLVDMELEQNDFQSPLPEQQVHVYFEDETLGLNVGVWTTTTMQETFGPYPGDEFMWVLEGQVTMVDADKNETLVKPGESFCVRNGIPISWKQEGFLRKFYITFSQPNTPMPEIDSANGGVRVLNADRLSDGLLASEHTEPFVIETGGPTQRDSPLFTNDSNTMFVGLWDSTTFESSMRPFPSHEFVQLLEGEVTISEENGKTQLFKAGDAFFIPMGTVCQWQVKDYIKKYYVIVKPVE
jgi:uncharacterized cupin superfamily protein